MVVQLVEAFPLPWLFIKSKQGKKTIPKPSFILNSLIKIERYRFVVRIPEKLAPEQAAPLLCGGVTAYSPLKQFNRSDKVISAGILGLGGVGHMGAKIAKAMGHNVTVISSSDKKREEALKHLGADAFLVSSNTAEMAEAANTLDYILDTVPAYHPLGPYLSLLKPDGRLIIVGAVPQPLQVDAVDLILGKLKFLVINSCQIFERLKLRWIYWVIGLVLYLVICALRK